MGEVGKGMAAGRGWDGEGSRQRRPAGAGSTDQPDGPGPASCTRGKSVKEGRRHSPSLSLCVAGWSLKVLAKAVVRRESRRAEEC